MLGNAKIFASISIVVLLLLSTNIGLIGLVKGNSGLISKEQPRMERVWLTVNGNQTGVKAGDMWGEIETFRNVSTGTLNNFDNVTLEQSSGIESVILDHHLWIMMRSNTTDAPVLKYTPEIRGNSWNISFEAYAPNGNNNLSAPGKYPQGFGLKAFITDQMGNKLAGAELSYGSPGYSFIRIYDANAGLWENVSGTILPSTAHKSSQCGIEPDCYIVSFNSSGGRTCNVTVLQTAMGVVGSRVVMMPLSATPYQLVMQGNAVILKKSVLSQQYLFCGGWFVDQLGCRGGTARYPIIGPTYEYVTENSSFSTNVVHATSNPITDAKVMIDGVRAFYNATTESYEVLLPVIVGWSIPLNYTITVDGIIVQGLVHVTYVSQALHASVSQWWNGWDWVSVFGLDDCNGPGQALRRYSGYNHPVTAYLLGSGGSAIDILPTQSEIALHDPHLWWETNSRFWNESTEMAGEGQRFLNQYAFASKWDDPAFGGNGHTFISMTNPGNHASYQLLYAEYQDGIRIDGYSGNNVSQLGSWNLPSRYVSPGSGWEPYMPMDLMDAARQLSTDKTQTWNSSFGIVDQVAKNHGLLRVYGHPNSSIMIPDILHWIDDNKTNYAYENWKATDGEVASYICGKWSTNVMFDNSLSNDGTLTFKVISKDLKAAGYWSVPITIAVDTHGRAVQDIVIIEGSNTYKMSDGSLNNLQGKRVMDAGYDIRGGKLYISEAWGTNATLRITFTDVPAAPQYLQCTPGNAQINLTWQAPSTYGISAIKNYNVYRSNAKAGSFSLIASLVALTYIDTNLTNGDTYWYEVSAVNAAGEGASSPAVSMTMPQPFSTFALVITMIAIGVVLASGLLVIRMRKEKR